MKKTVKISFAFLLSTALLFLNSLNAFASSADSEKATSSGIINYAQELLFGNGEYSEDDIIDLCESMNSAEGSTRRNNREICGTYCYMVLDDYIKKCENQRRSVPQIVTETWNMNFSDISIHRNDSQCFSEEGCFLIDYSELVQNGVRVDMNVIEEIGGIFESIRSKFIDTYSFQEPTTINRYYVINIMDDTNDDCTSYVQPYIGGYSSIYMGYNYFYNYVYALGERSSYVRGVCAHEYMHAIILSYEFPYADISQTWFHESLACAAGIETEEDFAKERTMCASIRNFISKINTSMASHTAGTPDEGRYRNGSCLFFLFLYDEYNEWDTVREILEYAEYPYDPMNMIDNCLYDTYEVTFEDAFGLFMTYNKNPDISYSMAPAHNYPEDEEKSWGTAELAEHFVFRDSINDWYCGDVSGLSVNYVVIHCLGTSPVSVSCLFCLLDNLSSSESCYIGIFRHNMSDWSYHLVASTTSGMYLGELLMSRSTNDELCLVIVNTTVTATSNFSYVVDVNS